MKALRLKKSYNHVEEGDGLMQRDYLIFSKN